ncbi:GNAT family N-acetyltransferase [Maribacter sp. 2210JD10-5]|uniref:GNAT family N-acetyltransferase n=1 Tax=Maribacter sp. 2210JD10-5 TaxID=3386272 RepID=UPI0039BCF833
MKSNLRIRLANNEDLEKLIVVGDALFDYPIKEKSAIAFLNSKRHHMAIALDNEKVVGMASGVHYVHPDKMPSLFIDEVGVLETHQNKGIGRSLVKFLNEHGKSLGCSSSWVLTDTDNVAAQKMYTASGGKKAPQHLIMFDFQLEENPKIKSGRNNGCQTKK